MILPVAVAWDLDDLARAADRGMPASVQVAIAELAPPPTPAEQVLLLRAGVDPAALPAMPGLEEAAAAPGPRWTLAALPPPSAPPSAPPPDLFPELSTAQERRLDPVSDRSWRPASHGVRRAQATGVFALGLSTAIVGTTLVVGDLAHAARYGSSGLPALAGGGLLLVSGATFVVGGPALRRWSTRPDRWEVGVDTEE